MAINRNAKSQVAVRAQQLSAGTVKHLTGTAQVVLLGSSFTPPQITSKLQTLIDLRADVDASKATTKAKIANEVTQMPALRAFMSAFESFIRATFGSSPDVLADFGLTPKPHPTLTVEAKAAAAAKRASTRAARHTMGSNQKKAIKGNVTGVLVSPIAVPTPVVTPVTTASGPTPPATSAGPTAASNPTPPATSTGPTVAVTPRTA